MRFGDRVGREPTPAGRNLGKEEEAAMDARTGADAITARLGAVALPLGIIIVIAVAEYCHPAREDP
jgi:hypothetical protein